MRKKIICCLVITLFSSVGIPRDFSTQNFGDEVECYFNSIDFKKRLESLVLLESKKRVSYKLKTENRLNSKLTYERIPDEVVSVISGKSDSSIYYYYIPDKYQSLNLAIIILNFKHPSECDSVFNKLDNLANKDEKTPGLTYSNDFVLKKTRSIFYLNAGCGMGLAFFKHVADLIIKDSTDKETDFILCQCGDVKCNKDFKALEK